MPDTTRIKSENNNLKSLSLVAFKFSFVYALLFILFLPFHQPLLPNIGAYLSPIIEPLIAWIGNALLGMQAPWTVRLESDSTGLYIFAGLLFFIAITAAFIWTSLEKVEQNYLPLRYWFRAGLSYFLSMHLIVYGLNKIFKVQFFLPEPNTLYTPVGQLSHDILFWTSMGSSYPYTVFSGLIELIPAVLLLFKRTRLLGAIISFAVMANVLMLNFGFDISVKIFSGFLLFASWLIISPNIGRLYQFFVLQKVSQLQAWRPNFINKFQKRGYLLSKTLLLLLLLFNGLLPYLQTGVYNDDIAPRPYLHGAYAVESFVINGDTLPALQTDKIRWQRIFVHRRGYLIIQNMQNKMKDFKLLVDKNKKLLYLTDYEENQYNFQFHYQPKDSILTLKGSLRNNQIGLIAKQLDLSKLPLLNPSFHWTVDQLIKKD